MNDELDVLRRVVDYHDHISAPQVPLADDLHRGRRRVRRNRGLVAGGVALGVASVVTAVTLATGDGAADRPQPAGPPGLTTPLVAPKSLLDVRELGFHVEAMEGLDLQPGWSIDNKGQDLMVRLDEIGSRVQVRVLYQGFRDYTVVCTQRHDDVTIHDVQGCYSDRPEEGVSEPTGIWDAHVVWEYAPDSWASVYAQYEPEDIESERVRSGLLQVAEAVAQGGQAVQVPFRLGEDPSSRVQPDTTNGVGVGVGLDGAEADAFISNLYFSVHPYGDGTHWRCETSSGIGAEPFTFGGHPGCVYWISGTDEPPASLDNSVNFMWLEVDGTVRGAVPRFGKGERGYSYAEVKQFLADLTVAPLDDPSTWFDLESAFND